MSGPSRHACAGMVLLAAGGCTNAVDLFEPRWDRVLSEEAKQYRPIEDLPRATPVTAPVPDVAAVGPLDLTVEQAVILALQENRDLAVTRMNPVIIGAFELVERGRFDPEIFAGADFARAEAVETARSTGEQFAVRSRDTGVIAGVRQTLPSGTDVSIDVSETGDTSSRTPEQHEARIGLTVTQALLRGFGPAVNLASVRQAQLDTLASLYELRGFIEALMARTETAYWRLILARQEIAIFERSLSIAQDQLAEIDQRIEVGVLAPTEAAAARSEVAFREQALINARSALTARRLELLRLVNPGGADALTREVTATSDPKLEPKPIDDLDDRVTLARQLRPDLNESRLRLERNRLETVVTRNGLLPRLDLFVALGKTGYDDDFFGSFGDLGGPNYDVAAGLSLSQFVDDQTARGLHRAALANRQQAAAAVQNLEQLIELEVRLAANEAERTRQQITASAATRRLQEATVEAEIERFDVGASTTLLVAQAQRDLLISQIDEVRAVINYRIALVELYLAEGSLLERRGIEVLPKPSV